MYPELFHIGSFAVSSYGVMMALGFLAGGWVLRWRLVKSGIKSDFAWIMVIVAVIGGILGAKIHFLIINPDLWPENLWSGRGLVWFGGMFGALLGATIVTLISKVRLMAVADGAGFAMAIGYAFGRMGCFLVGDDYGKDSTLPWAMGFPNGSPPTAPGQLVQPTQIYEVLGSLFILALLVWVISPRIKREGAIFFIYLILAGFARFMVEFVRLNEPVWGLTQQQWISVVLMVLGIAGTWWFGTHGRLRPAAAMSLPTWRGRAGGKECEDAPGATKGEKKSAEAAKKPAKSTGGTAAKPAKPAEAKKKPSSSAGKAE